MTAPFTNPIESLLSHRAWVRAIARAVARDAALAEDLEQDAWVAALRHRPQEREGNLRAWFAAVIERRHRERHRRDVRRDAREHAVPARRPAPATSSLVAEAEAHERVVHAVLELAEPYRETVLLRYFEGLPPGEIARRTDVPLETVRTRIKRAIELLRRALGAGRRGRRGDWLVLLAAMDALRGGTAGGKTAFAATTVAKVSLPVAVVLLAFVLLARWTDDGPSVRPSVAVATAESAQEVAAARVGPSRHRPTEPEADGAAAPQSAGMSAGGTVTGRVVAPDGRPVARAAVRVPQQVPGRVFEPGGPPRPGATDPGDHWVETDAEGRFELTGVKGTRLPVWVVATGARAVPVDLVTVADGERVAVGDVVVEPIGQAIVRGIVVSKASLPVEGGRVRIDYLCSTQVGTVADPPFGDLLYWSNDPPAVVRTWRDVSTLVEQDGTFELHVPVLPEGISLSLTVPGHLRAGTGPLHLRDGGEETVRFDVLPLTRARGFVVDAVDGHPIADAEVAFAQPNLPAFREHAVRTGSDGSFDVTAGVDWGWPSMLSVAASGYLTVIRTQEQGTTADGLRVSMHRECRIAGVVVLPDGSPVKGATVFASRGDPIDRDTSTFDAPSNTSTDEHGAFAFTKRWEGTWTLGAFSDWVTDGDFVKPDPVAVEAGREDVRIVVQPARSIEGTVVDEDEHAIGQVLLRSTRGGAVISSTWSGDDGRFRLRGVVGSVDVEATGTAYLPFRMPGVGAGARDLRVVLRRGMAIEGVVVDEGGRAVTDRRIVAIPSGSDPLATSPAPLPCAELGANGTFRLTGLAPGTWRLEALVDYLDTRRWLVGGERVTAGATGLRLTLVAGGAIEGIVLDSRGAPAKKVGVDVLFDPSASEGLHGTTGDDGRFRFTGIPPGGKYTVAASGARVSDVAPGAKDVRLVVDGDK